MRRGGSRVWGMTFSIVARSGDGTQFGVAVASKFLAVGAAVPAASVGVGAIATQSFVNLTYRPVGLQLLADGASAADTLAALTVGDRLREQRQAGVVGGVGRRCHVHRSRVLPLGRRGDRGRLRDPGQHPHRPAGRGRHGAGVPRDRRRRATGQPAARRADRRGPGRRRPARPAERRAARGLPRRRVRRGQRRAGRPAGRRPPGPGDRAGPAARPAPAVLRAPGPGRLPAPGRRAGRRGPHPAGGARLRAAGALDAALAAWAGVENLEERLVPGRIDPLVLDQLRAQP